MKAFTKTGLAYILQVIAVIILFGSIVFSSKEKSPGKKIDGNKPVVSKDSLVTTTPK